jgi:predicted  nucleic acid-binding Zn-ribbon protein
MDSILKDAPEPINPNELAACVSQLDGMARTYEVFKDAGRIAAQLRKATQWHTKMLQDLEALKLEVQDLEQRKVAMEDFIGSHSKQMAQYAAEQKETRRRIADEHREEMERLTNEEQAARQRLAEVQAALKGVFKQFSPAD